LSILDNAPWLNLEDSVKHLSVRLGEEIQERNILESAIRGRLQLSWYPEHSKIVILSKAFRYAILKAEYKDYQTTGKLPEHVETFKKSLSGEAEINLEKSYNDEPHYLGKEEGFNYRETSNFVNSPIKLTVDGKTYKTLLENSPFHKKFDRLQEQSGSTKDQLSCIFSPLSHLQNHTRVQQPTFHDESGNLCVALAPDEGELSWEEPRGSGFTNKKILTETLDIPKNEIVIRRDDLEAFIKNVKDS
jgi:hypothetical protein